jgi:hypothetical protein
MRKSLGPVFAAFLIVSIPATAVAQQAAPAHSDEAAKLAEARAIVRIISPPADQQRALTLLPKVVAEARPKFPPDVMADAGLQAVLDSESKQLMEQARPLMLKHMPDMLEAKTIAYTHEFSLAELKHIHAFGETPAGRHYLSRLASLNADPAVAKANSAMIADVRQLANAHKAELKEKNIAYVRAHPALAKKLAADERSK